jgi:hypothetical protein
MKRVRLPNVARSGATGVRQCSQNKQKKIAKRGETWHPVAKKQISPFFFHKKGETWHAVEQRVRQRSPYGHLPSWKVCVCVCVCVCVYTHKDADFSGCVCVYVYTYKDADFAEVFCLPIATSPDRRCVCIYTHTYTDTYFSDFFCQRYGDLGVCVCVCVCVCVHTSTCKDTHVSEFSVSAHGHFPSWTGLYCQVVIYLNFSEKSEYSGLIEQIH